MCFWGFAYLIEDVDKGRSIFALQRHRDVHTLLRFQRLDKGVWELSGFYVNRHDLRDEGIAGC